MRIKFLLCFLICASALLYARSNYAAIDSIALQLPENESRTVEGIAGYINRHFNSPDDKARAIYCWITRNISYDVANMYNTTFYQNKNEIVERTLKTRKGICISYADVFDTIAAQTGLIAYPVNGYTRQNGKVDALPHTWNALQIGHEWYLLDPTWGSGHIRNGKFERHPDDMLFKTDPQQLIRSHMPFDPVWQLLEYTVTNSDFYNNKTDAAEKQNFHYKQKLIEWLALPQAAQWKEAADRVEANGVNNALIYNYLQQTRQNIEALRQNEMVSLFNDAVKHLNNGVALMNEFINYRNKQFTPKKTDEAIRQMVDTVAIELTASKEKLNAVRNPDAQTLVSINRLHQTINQVTDQMNEQKAFLEKYFKTGKLFRKTLFYKYSVMGIPVS